MIAASRSTLVASLVLAVSCGGGGDITPPLEPPAYAAPTTMAVLGRGDFAPQRRTAELAVRGTTAYTTTWGNSATVASVFYIWDVAGDVPALLDSVKVESATTLGDVAISDDGSLLVIATERAGGGLAIYSLADPRHPALLARYVTANTTAGVHTAEIGRVNGKLYGFLSIDPTSTQAAQIVIVDLSVPGTPVEVHARTIGAPFVHDTFVRDGLLYLALWNDGVAIWDIGGGGRGGTPATPIELGRVRTANGEVHNVWWLKDPVTSVTRYAFIGQEGPGSVGVSSSGDVHVVDVSTPSAPREVAFYSVPGRRHAQLLGGRSERHPVRRVLQRRRAGARRPGRPRHLPRLAEVHPRRRDLPVRPAQDGARARHRPERGTRPRVRLGSPVSRRGGLCIRHAERPLEASRGEPALTLRWPSGRGDGFR